MTDTRSLRIASRFLVLGSAALVLGACVVAAPRLTEKLTAADRQAMADARQQALENNKSGEGLNWENPASDHRGVITPVLTYQSSANENCRDFQETISVDDQSYIDYGTACRLPDGLWERRDSYNPVGYGRYYESTYDTYGYAVGPYGYHSRYRYGHYGAYSHGGYHYGGHSYGGFGGIGINH